MSLERDFQQPLDSNYLEWTIEMEFFQPPVKTRPSLSIDVPKSNNSDGLRSILHQFPLETEHLKLEMDEI